MDTDGKRIFAAAEAGLFVLDLNDGSLQTISRVDGLSSAPVSTLNFDEASGTLLVGYIDGTLGILKGNDITHLPDIKNDQLIGDKTIYQIVVTNDSALLATGFGIVNIDFVNRRVNDTYLIGPNGSNLTVRDLAFYQGRIYAATDNGLYSANRNSAALADFNNWKAESVANRGVDRPYNYIEAFDNRLFLNYNSGQWPEDTLYVMEQGNWNRRSDLLNFYQMKGMHNSGDNLVVGELFGGMTFDRQLNKNVINSRYGENEEVGFINDALFVNGRFYLGENGAGIIKKSAVGDFMEIVVPNGPVKNNVWSLRHRGSRLWVAGGGVTQAQGNLFNRFYTYAYDAGRWTSFHEKDDTTFTGLFDPLSVAVDPADPDHVYIGTWGFGLVEMRNGQVMRILDMDNSPLEDRPEIPGSVFPAYVFYDLQGNLWVGNSFAEKLIKVLTPQGDWFEFNLGSDFGDRNFSKVFEPLITNTGQIWTIRPREGLFVFHPHDFADPTDDESRALSTNFGDGGLPSGDVKAVVEDATGEIWVGSDKGIAIFFNAEAVLSDQDVNAQQIFIEQDGNVQIVLETEQINSIAVDGGNRKWIGTQSSGLFLLSPDGTEQLAHFTIDNSPLVSNTIFDLSIDHTGGEIFVGTDRGIQSLQTDATLGQRSIGEVIVYPNPVEKDYDGEIVIDGLVSNSDVRITDVAGQLVNTTTSNGGRATWNGRNFRGEKVPTGVYLFFTTDEEGEETSVSKVMILR